MSKNNWLGGLAASAVASVLVSAPAFAKKPEANKDDKAAAHYCQNNTCKGKSACHGHGNENGCKGTNECKGKGWLSAKNAGECKKNGGVWTKEAAAPKSEEAPKKEEKKG